MNNYIAVALLLPLSCLYSANPTTTAARAINNLALDLLAQASKPQENTAFSPYSIQVALVMTYAGPRAILASKWPGCFITRPAIGMW